MPLDDSLLIRLSKELKGKMKRFDNINWSSWIRSQIRTKTDELEHLEALSERNFCHKCGARLLTPKDKFCSKCGEIQPQLTR